MTDDDNGRRDDIHALRCEAAKEFMAYIREQGIEWDYFDGPLEIGLFLEDQLEFDEDDPEAALAAQVEARIEEIVDTAVTVYTEGKSLKELKELYRDALLECVLGQHYEQAKYRGRR
jgi:hypothetical protein